MQGCRGQLFRCMSPKIDTAGAYLEYYEYMETWRNTMIWYILQCLGRNINVPNPKAVIIIINRMIFTTTGTHMRVGKGVKSQLQLLEVLFGHNSRVCHLFLLFNNFHCLMLIIRCSLRSKLFRECNSNKTLLPFGMM